MCGDYGILGGNDNRSMYIVTLNNSAMMIDMPANECYQCVSLQTSSNDQLTFYSERFVMVIIIIIMVIFRCYFSGELIAEI